MVECTLDGRSDLPLVGHLQLEFRGDSRTNHVHGDASTTTIDCPWMDSIDLAVVEKILLAFHHSKAIPMDNQGRTMDLSFVPTRHCSDGQVSTVDESYLFPMASYRLVMASVAISSLGSIVLVHGHGRGLFHGGGSIFLAGCTTWLVHVYQQ